MMLEIHGTEWKAQVSGSDHDVFFLSEVHNLPQAGNSPDGAVEPEPGARRTGVPLEEKCRPTAPVAFGP
jgi:hypothetical protein